MPNVRGYEPWPFRSLTPRGSKRGRRRECRQVLPQQRAEIEARLRSEGRLDPVPVVNSAPANERQP